MTTPPVHLIALSLLYAAGLVVSILARFWDPVSIWALLNFGVLLVAAWVLLLAHHAVHAVAARIVGLGVRSFDVGTGPRLLHTHLGGADVSIHLVPESGVVAFTAPAMRGIRKRLLVAILAAPAFHVAVVVAVVALLGGEGTLDRLGRPWQAGPAIVNMVLLANAVHLLNLIPFEIRRAGGGAVTPDMMRAIRVTTTTSDELLRLVAMHRYAECRALIARDRADEAVTLARALIDENRLPENIISMKWTLGTALMVAGQYREAHAVLVDTLGPPRPSGPGTPVALANAAWAALMTDDATLRDDADRLSREALERAPDEPHAARVRGTVLLRLGRTEEAARLLGWSARHARAPRARAYGASALAVVAARAGQAHEARARLAEARRFWPACDLLPWAEEEVTRT